MKMLGKRLYTYQTDDDDPIKTKKGMRKNEKNNWSKEAKEETEYYNSDSYWKDQGVDRDC